LFHLEDDVRRQRAASLTAGITLVILSL
jgi:hypothetical protein